MDVASRVFTIWAGSGYGLAVSRWQVIPNQKGPIDNKPALFQ